MVSSPEVCRMNGAKSKGAKTEQGKAIASRNATKHGLLAEKPPFLVTEDLSTFEGLMQGLIDHYQPENPVEHFLVQQVAMGMLKQYRLWNVETAIANIKVLKAKQKADFPDQVEPPEVDTSKTYAEYRETRTPLKTLVQREKNTLKALIVDLEYDLLHAQELGEKKTLNAMVESLGQNYCHESRDATMWRYHAEFEEWICDSWNGLKKRYTADMQEAVRRVHRLIGLAKERIAELDQTLGQMRAVEQDIQQAEIAKEGIQHPLMFIRYQATINRNLYDALERLEAMKERKNQDSMGSFGNSDS
ncbi:MAG: hypothetical protein AAF609_14070 [Cyanobacteria bacterium P01_C01_bin.120]